MTHAERTVNDHFESICHLHEKVKEFFKVSPALSSLEAPFFGKMVTFKRVGDEPDDIAIVCFPPTIDEWLEMRKNQKDA